MESKEQVTLGGRVFVTSKPDDMTFDQFAWIQSAAEKAGLGQELMARIEPLLKEAAETKEPISEEHAERLTSQIVSRAYAGRAHLDVLAGVLVEKGKTWTYQDAEKTREFLGAMKGQQDIEIANIVLAQAILGFFWSGLASMKTSPNSLMLRDVVENLIREEEESESVPASVSESSGS